MTLALATMLLPVAAVAAAGLVTFRLSISALEEFRQETVDESKRIEEVRTLLVEADDLGEAAVEESDRATGRQFVALSALIDRRFHDLQTLATQQERRLAAEADALWEKSAADIEAAKAAPKASANDDRLDPFHEDAKRLQAAFAARGYPWVPGGDPHKDEYRRWVEDMPDLPAGADAILRARARALERGDKKDAAELRQELGRLGIVVREEAKRQFWRRTRRQTEQPEP